MFYILKYIYDQTLNTEFNYFWNLIINSFLKPVWNGHVKYHNISCIGISYIAF